MKRRIALVTIATAFLTALLAMLALPAMADTDADPCRNFHWTGELVIHKLPKLP